MSVKSYVREFPHRFESEKGFLFHPERPASIECDILEIGPGRGDLLFALAEAYPERRIAAIELRDKRYNKLVRRVEARNHRNVQLIFGDARVAVSQLIPAESVGSIFVLFPDPWPKRRQSFRRLLNPEFLQEIIHCLKPGGTLTVKTDVGSYAASVRTDVSMLLSMEQLVSQNPTDSRGPIQTVTLYEEKRRAAGETIHTMTWRKCAVPISELARRDGR